MRQDLEEALSPRSQGFAHRSSGGERFTSRGSSSEATSAPAHAAGTSPAMQRQAEARPAVAGEGSGFTGAVAPSGNAAEPERQAEARPAVPGEESWADSMAVAVPAAQASSREPERHANGEPAVLCKGLGIRDAAQAMPADRESPLQPERQADGEPAVAGNGSGSRGAGPAAPADQARLLKPERQAGNQPAVLGVGVRVGDATRAAPADQARLLEAERQADGQPAAVSEAVERSADAVPPRAAECGSQDGEAFADPLGVRGSGEITEGSRLGWGSTGSAGEAPAAAVPVGSKAADEARAALQPDDGQGAADPAAGTGSPVMGSPASPFLDVHARAGDAGHVSPPDAGHLPAEISPREVRQLQPVIWLNGIDGNGAYGKQYIGVESRNWTAASCRLLSIS